jgi:prepilin-type N-terminal cleavage/methylation domain-containing protein
MEYAELKKDLPPLKKFFLLRPQTNNGSGFTLIELLIVIALISILVFLSGAHTTFLTRMVVRAELEHLYSVSYYLQRRALMLHKPQTLTFDVHTNSYQANGKKYRLASQVRFGTANGVKGPPSSPDVLIKKPITFINDNITFHPDGVIQAGAVYLTDSGKHCTYALSCSVSSVSYLRKYQYTDAWHIIS